jgi:CHAP domain
MENKKQKLTNVELILKIAESQLGVCENPKGSNWGSHIQKYLASVGITFPASWCMAFVYWCIEEGKIRVPDGKGGERNPLIKTGGVMKQWNEIESKYKKVKPMVGDIFIMDFGGGKGHTGLVTAVIKDKIYTIEGNSNDEGSREGYEVCRKPNGRLISSCKGFIRVM